MPGSSRHAPYRFLLTRRWVGLLVVALLVASGCVLLGFWQVDRLAQRHARNALLARSQVAPPVPPERLMGVGRGPRPQEEYSRVRAVGRYREGDQLLVRTRPYEGQVGYYVLTPLVTGTAGNRGPALLVNRGWVPNGNSATDLPEVPPPPTGTVTVTARVRVSEPPSTTGTPPRGQVTRIDVPAIARTLPYPVFGGYADLTAEQPRPATVPSRLPAPEPSEGPHLAYAFQWFLFAGLALGGYVVLARRETADREVARQERAPARVPRSRVG